MLPNDSTTEFDDAKIMEDARMEHDDDEFIGGQKIENAPIPGLANLDDSAVTKLKPRHTTPALDPM